MNKPRQGKPIRLIVQRSDETLNVASFVDDVLNYKAVDGGSGVNFVITNFQMVVPSGMMCG